MLASTQYMGWDSLLSPPALTLLLTALIAFVLTLKTSGYWTNWPVRINSVLFVLVMISQPLYKSRITHFLFEDYHLGLIWGLSFLPLIFGAILLVRRLHKNAWDKWFLVAFVAGEVFMAIMILIDPEVELIYIWFLSPVVLLGILALFKGERYRPMWSVCLFPLLAMICIICISAVRLN